MRVVLPVSPPLSAQHQFQHHPVALKGESAGRPQFDWVESLCEALLNIILSQMSQKEKAHSGV